MPGERPERLHSRLMMRPVSCALAVAVLLACDRDVPPRPDRRGDVSAEPSRAPAPRAELLLEAGDSTFWVRSGPDGIRLRGSPVLLARIDGRFHELYLADDDHSFYDAVFVGQRLWRRDLITGDSTLVMEDTLVDAAARRWARRHPDAELLEPDQDESDDPSTVATAEIDVLDVFGPWVTVEHDVSLDVEGDAYFHSLRREVLDLRTGRRVPLAAVVGATAAREVYATARARYAAALDSVRAARDERGRRAARVIASFPFDSTSFGLAAHDGAPVVTFLIPGHGKDGGGLGLPLAPVAITPPDWWREVAGMLPRSVGDSVDLWRAGSVSVEAHWRADNAPLALVLRDTAGGRWTAGHVPAPSRWLVRLDAPPVDSATRRALARAFDESALYSDDARTVARSTRPRARPRARAHEGRPRVVRARPLHHQPRT